MRPAAALRVTRHGAAVAAQMGRMEAAAVAAGRLTWPADLLAGRTPWRTLTGPVLDPALLEAHLPTTDPAPDAGTGAARALTAKPSSAASIPTRPSSADRLATTRPRGAPRLTARSAPVGAPTSVTAAARVPAGTPVLAGLVDRWTTKPWASLAGRRLSVGGGASPSSPPRVSPRSDRAITSHDGDVVRAVPGGSTIASWGNHGRRDVAARAGRGGSADRRDGADDAKQNPPLVAGTHDAAGMKLRSADPHESDADRRGGVTLGALVDGWAAEPAMAERPSPMSRAAAPPVHGSAAPTAVGSTAVTPPLGTAPDPDAIAEVLAELLAREAEAHGLDGRLT